jgi:hypothetical protein
VACARHVTILKTLDDEAAVAKLIARTGAGPHVVLRQTPRLRSPALTKGCRSVQEQDDVAFAGRFTQESPDLCKQTAGKQIVDMKWRAAVMWWDV